MYIQIKKSRLITLKLFLCFFLVITIGLTITIIISDVKEKKVRDEMQYENKKLLQKIYHTEDINDRLKNENNNT